MALYTNVTLAELIEETLDMLYRSTERPKAVALASALDAAGAVTTLTLSGDGGQFVGVSNVLEFGLERVLVIASDEASNPTFTVSRGYAGSTKAAHAEGDVGYVDPKFTRAQARRAILHCIKGPLTRHVPYHVSDIFFTDEIGGSGQQFVDLPDNVLDVVQVRYMSPTSGRIVDLPGWRFENDLPSQLVSSGKALRVPSFTATTDDLIVNYITPYDWHEADGDVVTDPLDSHYVPMLVGSEDVPVLYAVAYLSTGRELTRSEVDRVEEWSQDMADRRGVNLQALRQAWQLYYQRIDEAKRIHPIPKHRVYRRWQNPF